MSGIERLRELIEENGPDRYIVVPAVCGTYQGGYIAATRDIYGKLRIIYDQIMSNLDSERDRWDEELCEAQMDKHRVMAVYLEMNKHVSGVEGAEDSPVARWARELRDALKSDTSDSAEQQKPSCADAAETADVTSEAPKVTRDPDEDVSMSAYDLLPQEDREAIAWVREHGGLSDVRLCHNAADNRRVELCAALGIDLETGWADAMKAMRPRLMPEGMEWPSFEDGAQVNFGDVVSDGDETGRVYYVTFDTVNPVIIGFTDETPDRDPGTWLEVSVSDGERVKRPTPKVLDADGVEIRVGDTVWTDYGDGPWTVTKITTAHAWHVYGESDELGSLDMPPSSLTHRAPVLAADGKPLREGETVYHVADGRACVVREVRENGAVVEPVDGRPCGRCRADYLTHERPVADTWERLEEDVANASCPDVYCANRNIDASDTSYEWAMARDIVRRARALAGGA